MAETNTCVHCGQPIEWRQVRTVAFGSQNENMDWYHTDIGLYCPDGRHKATAA